MKLKTVILFVCFFIIMIDIVISQDHNSRESGFIGKGDINCFVYHRFGDDRYPSTNISINDFKSHLQYLKKNDFLVITLGEALALLMTDKGVPDKTVVLTIDDGYSSFLKNGMPLLRQYGYKATLFINTEQIGLNDFISWDEVRGLVLEGVEIGNHSHSHAYFINYKQDLIITEFKNDLEKSRKIFEEQLGEFPLLYSYPYGEYNLEMKEELIKQGFMAAVAQNSGVISGMSDLYALPRFPMTGIFSKPEKFIEKVNMKALPVKLVQEINPVLIDNNQPVLKLKLLDPEVINTKLIQCFIGGVKDCSIDYDGDLNIITIRSNHQLGARRTLYTVTAPAAHDNTSWYWFSYMWINQAKED